MKNLLLVFVGGGFGSVLRYIIGKYFYATQHGFPYGTFVVNILGSLLIGIIIGLAAKHNSISQSQTLLLATGFCGGFTTFSSFAFENHVFLKNGDFTSLTIYTIASFVLGILSVFLGLYIIKA